MKKEKENFRKYVKEHKKQIIFITILALLAYIVKLFFYSISIDNEAPVNNVNSSDSFWIVIGRWGVVMLEKIMHYGGRFNPILSNFIMIIFLVLSVTLLSYLIDKISKNQKKNTLVILGSFVVTSPTLAEMMNFSLMNAEVSIGLFFTIFSIYSLYIAIYEYKKIFYIFSILTLTIAMGEYQAFFPLFIGIASFIYAYEKIYIKDNKNIKSDIINIVKILGIFIISYILCTIITKTLQNILNIESSKYLTNQISWGRIPFVDSIRNIKNSIQMIVIPKDNIYFNYSFLFIIIGFIIFMISLFKHQKVKSILIILALMVSLISPFLMSILLGNVAVIRSQMNLPFITGLFVILFIDKVKKEKLQNIICILCIIFCLIQLKSTNDLFYSDYNRFREDVRLTQDIMNKIDMLDDLEENRENTKVVFIGMYSPKSTSVSIRGEVMGYSFYEWDNETKFASNMRIYGLTQTLGYKYIIPNEEDVSKSQNSIDKLDIYPSKNSIKVIDGMVIVRLS